ncbi:MAG: hypothetical protein ACTH4U_03915 [Pseudoalteromonas prydzensis]|uniref:hypothetical protein n=1 Tax=Pseudoalteromonas prydzensis TaxID=182141 RepID=UPI003F9DD780
MFKYCIYLLIVLKISGCTAVGVVVDNSVGNKPTIGPSSNSQQSAGVSIKNADGFSFSKFGNEIDLAIIEFIKEGANAKPKLVCQQITQAIKECEEVTSDNLTQKKATAPANTIDEIIGVRQ